MWCYHTTYFAKTREYISRPEQRKVCSMIISTTHKLSTEENVRIIEEEIVGYSKINGDDYESVTKIGWKLLEDEYNDGQYNENERTAYERGQRNMLLTFCRYVDLGYTAEKIRTMLLNEFQHLEH